MAARHLRRWRLYAGVRGKAGSGEPELPCGLWRRLQRREHRGGPLAGQARRRGGPRRYAQRPVVPGRGGIPVYAR